MQEYVPKEERWLKKWATKCFRLVWVRVRTSPPNKAVSERKCVISSFPVRCVWCNEIPNPRCWCPTLFHPVWHKKSHGAAAQWVEFKASSSRWNKDITRYRSVVRSVRIDGSRGSKAFGVRSQTKILHLIDFVSAHIHTRCTLSLSVRCACKRLLCGNEHQFKCDRRRCAGSGFGLPIR